MKSHWILLERERERVYVCVRLFIFCLFIWFNVCSPESDIRHVCVSGFWYVLKDFAILIKNVRMSLRVFEYSIRVDDHAFGDFK